MGTHWHPLNRHGDLAEQDHPATTRPHRAQTRCRFGLNISGTYFLGAGQGYYYCYKDTRH